MWSTARKLTLTAALIAGPLLGASLPHPGLVRTSRDVAGLATSFAYDDLGRVTAVTPQEDAPTSFTYTPAAETTSARVTVTRGNAGSPVKLTEQHILFDGFGQACVTQEKLPSGTWNRQDTLYHATGWKDQESVVYGITTQASKCRLCGSVSSAPCSAAPLCSALVLVFMNPSRHWP